MNYRFNVNDFVYTMVKFEGAIDIEQKQVKAIKRTCLGITYDCLGSDNEIEICFENNLYTLDELINNEELGF